MPIATELKDLGTGRPVKADFQPRLLREKTSQTIKRTSVNSARELSQKNRELAQGTPFDLGSTATKIQRQFASGKIDILA